MGVRVERSGRVSTVILERPEVRNAVDGPCAALAVALSAPGSGGGVRRFREGAGRGGAPV